MKTLSNILDDFTFAIAFVLIVLGFLSPSVHGQATQPAYFPRTQPYPIDRAFYVSTTGSDTTGDGSFTKPFASVGKANTAITVARFARGTTSNDAILLFPAIYPFHWPQSVDNDNCIIGSVGATVTDRAILLCDQTAFNIAGHHGVHFVGIDLRAVGRDPFQLGYVAREGGVGFNFIRNGQGVGCDDATLDNCAAWWFGQGISFLGDNGQRLRVWNGNYSHNYENSNGMPQKSQGIYHEGSQADIRYNVIAFNGWTGKEDLSNPAVVTALMFSHGVYCSAYGNPKPGISQGNFYVNNAASGLQMRTGGIVSGDVYSTNGTACDVFTDGASGSICGNLILGNREAGLFSGGGLLGQSDGQVIAGNVLLRSNPTSAPGMLIGWNGSGNDITGGVKPSPTSTGIVSGNFGVWPGPIITVNVPRTFQTLAPNPIIKPTGALPDLIDWALSVGYTGQATHAGVVQWLRDNPTKVDAPGCVAWGSAIATKLTGNPVIVSPFPLPAPPAPFDVVIHVDPVAGKVTVK